jgi:hypothetical protein
MASSHWAAAEYAAALILGNLRVKNQVVRTAAQTVNAASSHKAILVAIRLA